MHRHTHCSEQGGMLRTRRKTQLGALEQREGEAGVPPTQLGCEGKAALALPAQLHVRRWLLQDMQLPSTAALQRPGSCSPSHGWLKDQPKPQEQHGSSSPLWGSPAQLGTISLAPHSPIFNLQRIIRVLQVIIRCCLLRTPAQPQHLSCVLQGEESRVRPAPPTQLWPHSWQLGRGSPCA